MYDYSSANWDGLGEHMRDVPWEDIFEPGVFAAATIGICQGIHAGIDVYVPCCKYQVNLLSFPWFPAACTV